MKTSECKSCGAEIIWVRMDESGKAMPIDAIPEKRVVLLDRTFGAQDPTPVAKMETTYISHFATCPNADKHRKPDPQPEPFPADDDFKSS